GHAQGGERYEPFEFDASGFSPFFETLFGGAHGAFGESPDELRRAFRGARGPRSGRSVEAEVVIELEDAYRGATRTITLERGDGAPPRSFDVKIPAGTRPGGTIRLRGQGEPGHAGGAPGDLLLRVEIRPHPRFRV